MPVVQNHEISILIGRIRLTTMLMASVAGVTAFGTALAGTKPDTSQLLSIAGAKAGIPAEQLKIASHFEQQFRLTGVTLDVTKVFDSSTGKATLIAVDEQDQPVDLDTATAREDRARTAKSWMGSRSKWPRTRFSLYQYRQPSYNLHGHQ